MTRLEKAIARLQEMEPPEGYWLAFSGGKDSVCCHRLCEIAGVKFTANMSLTTVDPPELIYFVRKHYPDTIWRKPEKTMWELISTIKMMPPLRQQRWCCRWLKENVGLGHWIVTGIRWAESNRRAKREWYEPHKGKDGTRTYFVHPIIEWSWCNVWQFIEAERLPYCSLYDEGFKRIGCVMCPQQGLRWMRRDAARWPKYAAAYKRAICRAYDARKAAGKKCTWESGEAMYNWWIGNTHSEGSECQGLLFDN